MTNKQFPVGTEVRVSEKLHGGSSTGFVIGTSHRADSVVVIADEEAIGCPVNVHWLTATGTFDAERADEYRKRYAARHPKQLQ